MAPAASLTPRYGAGRPAPRWVGGLALLVLLLAGLGYGFLPAQPGSARHVLFSVVPGESAREVARALHRAGLIRSPEAFLLLAELGGFAGDLHAGLYRLSPGQGPAAILHALVAGQVAERLTVPPGFDVRQIAARMAALGLGRRRAILQLMRAGPFRFPWLPPPGKVRYRLEGFLAPATYPVARGLRPRQVIAAMLATFRARWLTPRDIAAGRREGLSPLGIVTLASIVEREARRPAERPLVAAVFLNRLRRHMPLQSDATVLYALGRAGGDLTARDLAVRSPYNTYLHPGLPPGPICSPSRASIEAVLHPAHVAYLYFARPPGGRGLVFSTTYAGQMRAERAPGGGAGQGGRSKKTP